jgi:hypothetical protein
VNLHESVAKHLDSYGGENYANKTPLNCTFDILPYDNMNGSKENLIMTTPSNVSVSRRSSKKLINNSSNQQNVLQQSRSVWKMADLNDRPTKNSTNKALMSAKSNHSLNNQMSYNNLHLSHKQLNQHLNSQTPLANTTNINKVNNINDTTNGNNYNNGNNINNAKNNNHMNLNMQNLHHNHQTTWVFFRDTFF